MNKISPKVSSAFFAVFLIGSTLTPSFAVAQTEELKSALQSVTDSTDVLKDVKASTTPVVDSKDLLTRKTALEKVFNLTILEIKEFNKKVSAIKKTDDENLFNSAKVLLIDLDSYASKTEAFRKVLGKKDLTVDQIKNLAGDVKDWREKIYDPEIKVVLDLILLVQSQDVLKTAEVRLQKIEVDVKKIESALSIDPAHFRPHLIESAKDLARAKDYQNMARSLFLDSFQKFLLARPRGVPIVLKYEVDGTFRCISSGISADGKIATMDCQSGFINKNGETYKLIYPAGISAERTGEISGIYYAGEGAREADKIIGTIRVGVQIPVPANPTQTDQDETRVIPTVQFFIKAGFEQIASAYKTFFAMSKIAKKLVSP